MTYVFWSLSKIINFCRLIVIKSIRSISYDLFCLSDQQIIHFCNDLYGLRTDEHLFQGFWLGLLFVGILGKHYFTVWYGRGRDCFAGQYVWCCLSVDGDYQFVHLYVHLYQEWLDSFSASTALDDVHSFSSS